MDTTRFFKVCLAIFRHLYMKGLKQVKYKIFLFSIFFHINSSQSLTGDHEQRQITRIFIDFQSCN